MARLASGTADFAPFRNSERRSMVIVRHLRQSWRICNEPPILILEVGGLADAGTTTVKMVVCTRDLEWQSVMGNIDEVLFWPESLVGRPKSSLLQKCKAPSAR